MSVAPPILLLAMICVLPVMGFYLAALPWVMDAGDSFSVSIPAERHDDPEVRHLRLLFSACIVATTLVVSVVDGLLMYRCSTQVALGCLFLFALLQVCLAFCLFQLFRSRSAEIKLRRGWSVPQQSGALLIGRHALTRPLSLSIYIVYLPIFFLVLYLIWFSYPSMPDVLVVHATIAGTVDIAAQKTLTTACIPALIQLVIAVALVLTHGNLLRAKNVSKKSRAPQSTLGKAIYARAESVACAVAGIFLVDMLGPIMVLYLLEALTTLQAACAIVLSIIPFLVAQLWLGFVMGKSGNRIEDRLGTASRADFDLPSFWKMGLLYINPADANVIVRQRLYIGWTLNWARPGAYLAAIAAIVCVFAAGAGTILGA